MSSIFGGPPRAHHLALSVANLEAAIQWYAETLGFRVSKTFERAEPPIRIALLTLEGFAVELIERGGSQSRTVAGKPPSEQNKIQGHSHFAWMVPDLDATVAALRAKEVHFAVEPIEIPALGLRVCHIYDREGNLLEFVQELESAG